jgi:hypothetical protein
MTTTEMNTIELLHTDDPCGWSGHSTSSLLNQYLLIKNKNQAIGSV